MNSVIDIVFCQYLKAALFCSFLIVFKNNNQNQKKLNLKLLKNSLFLKQFGTYIKYNPFYMIWEDLIFGANLNFLF